MKHRITVCTVVDDKFREVAIWTDEPKEIGIGGIKISTPDNICIVSLTKNTVILSKKQLIIQRMLTRMLTACLLWAATKI